MRLPVIGSSSDTSTPAANWPFFDAMSTRGQKDSAMARRISSAPHSATKLHQNSAGCAGSLTKRNSTSPISLSSSSSVSHTTP